MTLHRSNPGFTLVELLVVIGIISILVAILLPALARARDSAVRIQCASNMRQIMLVTEMHAFEHKGWLPAMQSGPGSGNAVQVSNGSNLTQLMSWQVGTPEAPAGSGTGRIHPVPRIYFCPADYNPNNNPLTTDPRNISYSTLRAPYEYANPLFRPSPGGTPADFKMPINKDRIRPLRKKTSPSEMVLYVEAPHNRVMYSEFFTDQIIPAPSYDPSYGLNHRWGYALRHGGQGGLDSWGAHLAYMDGHVEYRSTWRDLHRDPCVGGATNVSGSWQMNYLYFWLY